MEDIAADDDILSDMLLDSLEFEPPVSTHKMNQAYRSPRFDTQHVIDIVRNKVVIDADVTEALEELCKMGVVKKHLQGKSLRQVQGFQLHARRYLETYLPDSGVEFALTTRYKRTAARSLLGETSKAGQEAAQAQADAVAAVAAARATTTAPASNGKGKARLSGGDGGGNITALTSNSKADLCVVATKPFKAGDLVLMCKGGVKDLTKSEDEALREEASMSREKRREETYAGVLGPGRDFSVIRSARKGCSQLLLGPARFVNHDCDPNAEFHRLGSSQMVFKCLRPIGLNEEITTYYGDNYFEWANAECMCLTCEIRGKGAFAKAEMASVLALDENEAVAATEADVEPSTEHGGGGGGGGGRQSGLRRASQRKKASSPSTPDPHHTHGSSNGSGHPTPTTATVQRNGTTFEKTFEHAVSDREFDDTVFAWQRGPRCTCLTCGSPFWAPESWWTPDECRRCERHYRIFKADWPGRMPTEGGWSKKALNKRKAREELQLVASGGSAQDEDRDAEYDKFLHPAKRRQLKPGTKAERKKLASPSVSSNSSSSLSEVTVDSPVKLSPLRDTDPNEPSVAIEPSSAKKRSQTTLKSNKASIRDHEKGSGRTIGDGTDEDFIDASLNVISSDRVRAKTSAPPASAAQPRGKEASAYSDDDSDLTDMSEDNAIDTTLTGQRDSRSDVSSEASSSSDDKPSGPKMLGKEAKTETLALFWGAPTGNRRNRRQSNNGLESLARNVKREGSHLRRGSSGPGLGHGHGAKHRRTASDLSQTGSSSGTQRASSTSNGKGHRQGMNSPARDSDAGSRSPWGTSHLATSSAGRPVNEDSISPSTFSPGAQRGEDRSEHSGSASGEEHDGGVRRAAEEGSMDMSQQGVSTPPVSGNIHMSNLATQGPARTSVKNLAMAWGAGIEEGEGRTRRKISSKEAASMTKRALGVGEVKSRSITPEIKPHKRLASPLSPASMRDEELGEDMPGSLASDQRHLKAQSQQLPHQHQHQHQLPQVPLKQESCSPARATSFSPLAGPPPSHFAARPGITPGQPIRRNLRWGSGKVSSSRPMSLAGPGSGIGGTQGSASDGNIPRSQEHAITSPQQTPLHKHQNGGGQERKVSVAGSGGAISEAPRRSISGPVLSPMRERLSSPLAKAAMTAANNGGGAGHRGASPCDSSSFIKDRASPVSAMGPPMATAMIVKQASPFSPGRDSSPLSSRNLQTSVKDNEKLAITSELPSSPLPAQEEGTTAPAAHSPSVKAGHPAVKLEGNGAHSQ